MKAEINELRGIFKLPGCCPVEAVEDKYSSSVVLTDMRPVLI